MINHILTAIQVSSILILLTIIPFYIVSKKNHKNFLELILNNFTRGIFWLLVISFVLLLIKAYNAVTLFSVYFLIIIVIGVINRNGIIPKFKNIKFKENIFVFLFLLLIILGASYIMFYMPFNYADYGGGDSFENTYRARVMESNTLFKGYLAPGYFLFLAALHKFSNLFGDSVFNFYNITRFIGPILGIFFLIAIYAVSRKIIKNPYLALIPTSILGLITTSHLPLLSEFSKIFHLTFDQLIISLEQNLALVFMIIALYYAIAIILEKNDGYKLLLFQALTIIFMTHLLIFGIVALMLFALVLAGFIHKTISFKKAVKISIISFFALIPEIVYNALIFLSKTLDPSLKRNLILLKITPLTSLIRSYSHVLFIVTISVFSLYRRKREEKKYVTFILIFSILLMPLAIFYAPYRLWPFFAIITALALGVFVKDILNLQIFDKLRKFKYHLAITILGFLVILSLAFPLTPITRDNTLFPSTINEGFVKATLKIYENYPLEESTFYAGKTLYYEGISLVGLDTDWRDLEAITSTNPNNYATKAKYEFVYIDKELNPILEIWLPKVRPEYGNYEEIQKRAKNWIKNYENAKVVYEDEKFIAYIIS